MEAGGEICIEKKCQNATKSSPKLRAPTQIIYTWSNKTLWSYLVFFHDLDVKEGPHSASQNKPVGIVAPRCIGSSSHCQQSFSRNQSRNSSAPLLAALAVRNGHSGNQGCLKMFLTVRKITLQRYAK